MEHQIHKTDPPTTTGQQPLPKTREMHLLDNKSGVPRTDHSVKPHLNRPCETGWNQRLAGTDNSETSMILPRIWELLSTIHTRLWKPHPTSQRPIKEG